MSIKVEGFTSVAVNTATGNIAKPLRKDSSPLQVGDLLILFSHTGGTGSTLTINTSTWTQLIATAVYGRNVLYYRFVQAGEPTSYDFTFAGQANPSIVAIQAYSGVKAIGTALSQTAGTNQSNLVAPSQTPPFDRGTLITWHTSSGNNITAASAFDANPSGMTHEMEINSGSINSTKRLGGLFSQDLGAGSINVATGTKTASITHTGTGYNCQSFVLEPFPTLFPSSIPSAEVFGIPDISPKWIYGQGITSEEVFGTQQIKLAAKTFYITETKNGVDNHLNLDTDPQTEATMATGWLVEGKAATHYSYMSGGVQRANNTTTWVTTVLPVDPPQGTLGDCFRTPLLTGEFADTPWTFNFEMIATNGTAQDGLIRFRMYKSANADGSNATLIMDTQETNAGNITTAGPTLLTKTVSPGFFTLNNEYVFIQIVWDITGAGGANDNVRFRRGPNSNIKTSDFVPLRQAITTHSSKNLLPVNIATGAAVTPSPDIQTYTAFGTLSVDSSVFYEGGQSIKMDDSAAPVSTPANNTYGINVLTRRTIPANNYFVGSAYVKAPVGFTYSVIPRTYTAAGVLIAQGSTNQYTGNGQWQRVETPVMNAAETYRASILIVHTNDHVGIYHVDAMQVEVTTSGGSATSWEPPSAIPMSEAYGTPVFTTGPVSVSGIGDIHVPSVFGTHRLDLGLALQAIDSEELFGTHRLDLAIVTTGLATDETFGLPIISTGDLTIILQSVPPGEAFGDILFSLNLGAVAIDDPDAYGTPDISPGPYLVELPAIDPTLVFGTHVFTPGPVDVTASSIDPTLNFGTQRLDFVLESLGIDPEEVFGTQSFSPGPVTVNLQSAQYEEAFGLWVLSYLQGVTLFAVDSEETFGNGIFTPGQVNVIAIGIPSEEGVGFHLFSANPTIRPEPIPSEEAFGLPILDTAGRWRLGRYVI